MGKEESSGNIFSALASALRAGPKTTLRKKIQAGIAMLASENQDSSTNPNTFIKTTERELQNSSLTKQELEAILSKVNAEIKKQQPAYLSSLREKINAGLETLRNEIQKDTTDANAFVNASLTNATNAHMQNYVNYKNKIEKKLQNPSLNKKELLEILTNLNAEIKKQQQSYFALDTAPENQLAPPSTNAERDSYFPPDTIARTSRSSLHIDANAQYERLPLPPIDIDDLNEEKTNAAREKIKITGERLMDALTDLEKSVLPQNAQVSAADLRSIRNQIISAGNIITATDFHKKNNENNINAFNLAFETNIVSAIKLTTSAILTATPTEHDDPLVQANNKETITAILGHTQRIVEDIKELEGLIKNTLIVLPLESPPILNADVDITTATNTDTNVAAHTAPIGTRDDDVGSEDQSPPGPNPDFATPVTVPTAEVTTTQPILMDQEISLIISKNNSAAEQLLLSIPNESLRNEIKVITDQNTEKYTAASLNLNDATALRELDVIMEENCYKIANKLKNAGRVIGANFGAYINLNIELNRRFQNLPIVAPVLPTTQLPPAGAEITPAVPDTAAAAAAAAAAATPATATATPATATATPAPAPATPAPDTAIRATAGVSATAVPATATTVAPTTTPPNTQPSHDDYQKALNKVKEIGKQIISQLGHPNKPYNKKEKALMNAIVRQFHIMELLPTSIALKNKIGLLQLTIGKDLIHSNTNIQTLLVDLHKASGDALNIMAEINKKYETSLLTEASKPFPIDPTITLFENYQRNKAAVTSTTTATPAENNDPDARLQLDAGDTQTIYPTLHEKLQATEMRISTVSTTAGNINYVETIKAGVASSIVYDVPPELDPKAIWQKTCDKIMNAESSAALYPIMQGLQKKFESGDIKPDLSNLAKIIKTEFENNATVDRLIPNKNKQSIADALATSFKENYAANTQLEKFKGYIFPSDDLIKLSISQMSNLVQLRPKETIHIKSAMSREAAMAAILTGAAFGIKVENNSRYKDLMPDSPAKMATMVAAYKLLLREKNFEYGSLHNPKIQQHPEVTIQKMRRP